MNDSRGSLFVISGPAGSGKGSIVKELLAADPNIKLSVSLTTRSPRPGEIEGVSYFYVTKKRFEELLKDGKVLEYTTYCDNYYGTPADYVKDLTERGEDVILEIETEGAMQIKKLYPETVLVFVLPESKKKIYERLISRATESEEVIRQRMRKAETEIERSLFYDYLIVNETDRLDKAAEETMAVIRAQRLKIKNNIGFIKKIKEEKEL